MFSLDTSAGRTLWTLPPYFIYLHIFNISRPTLDFFKINDMSFIVRENGVRDSTRFSPKLTHTECWLFHLVWHFVQMRVHYSFLTQTRWETKKHALCIRFAGLLMSAEAGLCFLFQNQREQTGVCDTGRPSLLIVVFVPFFGFLLYSSAWSQFMI